MTSADDFRQLIESGDFASAFSQIITKLVTLEVVTNISDGYPSTSHHPEIRTKFNLLEGEITTEVDQTLLGNNNYLDLEKLHSKEIVAACQLIESQISMLGNLTNGNISLPDQGTNLSLNSVLSDRLTHQRLIVTNDLNQTHSSSQLSTDDRAFLEPIGPSNSEVVLTSDMDYSSIDDWTTISHIPDPEEVESVPESLETSEIMEAIASSISEGNDWGEEKVIPNSGYPKGKLLVSPIPDWDEQDLWEVDPRDYTIGSEIPNNIDDLPVNYQNRDKFNPEYMGLACDLSKIDNEFMNNPNYMEGLLSLEDVMELEDRRVIDS